MLLYCQCAFSERLETEAGGRERMGGMGTTLPWPGAITHRTVTLACVSQPVGGGLGETPVHIIIDP